MSHEIRTPLNAILGFSNLLKRDNLSSEKKNKYLDFVESGGKKLLRIISDVVDLSKMDTNHLTLSYETCNLNKLITKLQEEFNLNLKNQKQMVVVQKGLKNNESYIITDQTRLEQILSNLIENSVKYAPNGNILIGYKRSGEMIKFYVKDEGEGIEEKDHESIFGRFKQIENQYSRTNTSTGLGLSIVKELTELMKCKVWVESIKGRGAVFYFTIPYQRANRRMDYIKKEIISIKMDTKEVILIAEDEIINFLYLEALFESYPFKIIHAKNGKEAIQMLEENEAISLILMDIKMPIMNGIEATMEIRKKNKLPAETYSVDFELEYGTATIEVHKDSIDKNDSVLIIDDLIATGGTAEAAAKLVEISGGKVAAFVFAINLFDLGGSDNLVKKGYKIENLMNFPGH